MLPSCPAATCGAASTRRLRGGSWRAGHGEAVTTVGAARPGSCTRAVTGRPPDPPRLNWCSRRPAHGWQ